MSEHSHDHGSGHDHDHEHEHSHGHSHDHAPEDQHGHEPSREAIHGPSPAASVILELSDRIGALIIEASAELTGVEIEISLVGATVRTHSMVRERLTQPVRQYSAVYPALEAGDYVIWQVNGGQAGTVTVPGGEVTRYALTKLSSAAAVR
jgi:hypothetical protein